jgi:hypothetical protein
MAVDRRNLPPATDDDKRAVLSRKNPARLLGRELINLVEMMWSICPATLSKELENE